MNDQTLRRLLKRAAESAGDPRPISADLAERVRRISRRRNRIGTAAALLGTALLALLAWMHGGANSTVVIADGRNEVVPVVADGQTNTVDPRIASERQQIEQRERLSAARNVLDAIGLTPVAMEDASDGIAGYVGFDRLTLDLPVFWAAGGH